MRTFLSALFMFIALFAVGQNLIEVRGIETTEVSNGFKFTNQNNFPVSVEATYFKSSVEVDAKSFELDAKESYVWQMLKAGGYVKYKAYKSTAVISYNNSNDNMTSSDTNNSENSTITYETAKAIVESLKRVSSRLLR